MDPATVALAIKALDTAFVLGSYLVERANSAEEKAAMSDALVQLSSLQRQVELGTIEHDKAAEEIGRIRDMALAPLRAAMKRL